FHRCPRLRCTLLWPWQERSRSASRLFRDWHRNVTALAFAVDDLEGGALRRRSNALRHGLCCIHRLAGGLSNDTSSEHTLPRTCSFALHLRAMTLLRVWHRHDLDDLDPRALSHFQVRMVLAEHLRGRVM